MDGLFGDDGALPADYGSGRATGGVMADGLAGRLDAGSPGYTPPAYTGAQSIPPNNAGVTLPVAMGPQSPNTGPWGGAGGYGALAGYGAAGSDVCPDPTNPAYAYQLMPDGAIQIVKSPHGGGKIVPPGTRGYAEMRAVIDACMRRRPIDPAVAAAAIRAAATIAATAIDPSRARPKRKRPKFQGSGMATAPPPAAEPMVPTWVWWGAGGVLVLGLGLAVFTAMRK
jgi:hypothetical protein